MNIAPSCKGLTRQFKIVYFGKILKTTSKYLSSAQNCLVSVFALAFSKRKSHVACISRFIFKNPISIKVLFFFSGCSR